MPVVAERKALFARRDLVDQLIDIANRKGMSLYNLVNELFESYIKIAGSGVGFESLQDEAMFFRRISSAGFILIPRALAISALREYYSNGAERASGQCAQTGSWLARYYISTNSIDPLNSLLKDLERVFKWVGEITLRAVGNRLEAVIASPEGTERFVLDAILAVIEGALREFKYQLVERLEAGGLIKAVFERRCQQ